MANEDLIALVRDMDRCWIEGRFQDLAEFIADDVVLVAPGGQARIAGLDEAIESYRGFMSQAQVDQFTTSNYFVTARGDAAVVEYEWQMIWSSEGVQHDETGREILVLALRDGRWRVVWRTQIPSP